LRSWAITQCVLLVSRFVTPLTVLLLVTALAGWSWPTDMPRGEPILIGQIASLTGNNPGGLDNEQGAALAAGEINAAGGLLNHRPIEIMVEDDQTRPEGAVAAWDRLMLRHPAAVVGTSYSNASLAVIPLAEKLGVPYVSTGAADDQVEPIRSYVFMTPLSGRLVAEQLLRYLEHEHVTRLAVIYDSSSQFARTAWSRQHSMLASHGIELTAELPINVDTKDFRTVLSAADASGAQAIMAWVTGPPAGGLLTDYGSLSRRLPLFLSHGAASPALFKAVGPAGEGVTVAAALGAVDSQLPPSPVRQAAVGMHEAYLARFGKEPSQFAIDGYVAVKLLAAAIAQAQNDQPSAIQQALAGLALITPQGEYRFSKDNHSGLRPDDVAITVIRDGRFTLTDWSRDHLTARYGGPAQ
jgi:branched-chain amino acid transport system substrate-binding protein